MGKALVSICLTAHNRKKFIEAALKSILGQTYSPLEIIISDNASTDGTSEIILSMVDAYVRNGGPHKIIYKRNEQNIGAIRNVEQSYKMASGKLLVEACDDDIAFPERVEKMVEAWEEGGRKDSVLIHSVIEIDPGGHVLRTRDCGMHDFRLPLGCAMAFSPKVVTQFQDIAKPDAGDDAVFCFRGLHFGNMRWIHEPLLYYRVGMGVSSATYRFDLARKRISDMMQACLPQMQKDMADAGPGLSPSKRAEMAGKFEAYAKNAEIWRQEAYGGNTLKERLEIRRNRMWLNASKVWQLLCWPYDVLPKGFRSCAIVGYCFLRYWRDRLMFKGRVG